jgi:DNA repair exonuclease SbcCD ATPase subunit
LVKDYEKVIAQYQEKQEKLETQLEDRIAVYKTLLEKNNEYYETNLKLHKSNDSLKAELIVAQAAAAKAQKAEAEALKLVKEKLVELTEAEQELQKVQEQLKELREAAKAQKPGDEERERKQGRQAGPQNAPSALRQFGAFASFGVSTGFLAKYVLEQLATSSINLPIELSTKVVICTSVVAAIIAGSAALYSERTNNQEAAIQ